jgi:hypothetical protein
MLEPLIYTGLSAFLLVFLFKDSIGPFDMFDKIRALICRYDSMNLPSNFFAKLFECHWCMSVWAAMFLSIFVTLVMGLLWYMLILLWLASAALAGIIYTVLFEH